MRYSHQRETIKNIVSSSDSHPTADLIFTITKKTIPNISLGTIYRNLKQLEDEGAIKTIYDNNVVRYDWNTKPHNHLKCKKCGDLLDINLKYGKLTSSIKRKFKFDVDDVEITVIGTCSKHANK